MSIIGGRGWNGGPARRSVGPRPGRDPARGRVDEKIRQHGRARSGNPQERLPASAVCKYIGEAEKNLVSVLSRADSPPSLPLLDEADALFGIRTEFESASDRLANVDTDNLRRWIQGPSGIEMLTGNTREHIDNASPRLVHRAIRPSRDGAREAPAPADGLLPDDLM